MERVGLTTDRTEGNSRRAHPGGGEERVDATPSLAACSLRLCRALPGSAANNKTPTAFAEGRTDEAKMLH